MLRFPPPPACYTDVLSVQGLSVGWGAAPNSNNAASIASAEDAEVVADSAAAAAAPARMVLQDVNFTVRKGQRVLVLGPNGAGKSTLLKALSGRLQPWSGSVSQGQGVKLGKFTEHGGKFCGRFWGRA
jgi:ATPase subunit of ABC transporter with duplicated ATPase domains